LTLIQSFEGDVDATDQMTLKKLADEIKNSANNISINFMPDEADANGDARHHTATPSEKDVANAKEREVEHEADSALAENAAIFNDSPSSSSLGSVGSGSGSSDSEDDLMLGFTPVGGSVAHETADRRHRVDGDDMSSTEDTGKC
jgi:hypothetical protein